MCATDLVNFWARFDPTHPSVWTAKNSGVSFIGPWPRIRLWGTMLCLRRGHARRGHVGSMCTWSRVPLPLLTWWARFDPSPPPSVWTSKKNQASVIMDLDLEYVCGGPCCACEGAIRGKENLFLFLDFKCYVQITLKMTKLQQSKYWM